MLSRYDYLLGMVYGIGLEGRGVRQGRLVATRGTTSWTRGRRARARGPGCRYEYDRGGGELGVKGWRVSVQFQDR